MRGVLDRLGWVLAGVVAIVTVMAIARVVAGGPLDPPAPPAGTDGVKLPGTPISSLPYSISAPGHYYVTRDLTGVSGQHGIEVNSNDVSIDLGVTSELPFPRVARPAVEAAMAAVMAGMGRVFAHHLLKHLGEK